MHVECLLRGERHLTVTKSLFPIRQSPNWEHITTVRVA